MVDISQILNNRKNQLSNGVDIFNPSSAKQPSPSDIDNGTYQSTTNSALNRQVEIGLGTRLEHRIDDGAKMDYMKSLSNEDKQLMYHFRDEGYGFRASKALLENKDKLADPMQYGTAKYKDYERNEKFYHAGGYDLRRTEEAGNKNLTRFGDNADQYNAWVDANRDNWNIFQKAGAGVVGGISTGVGKVMEGIAGLGDKVGAGFESLWDKLFLGMDTDASFYRHTDRRVDEDALGVVEGAAETYVSAQMAALTVSNPAVGVGLELFNNSEAGEFVNGKVAEGIHTVITNTPGLKTYYRSLDDQGREDIEQAVALGATIAVMKGAGKGIKRAKTNTKAGRWVAEQEAYFNKMKTVTKEAFKFAKEGAKEQIGKEIENRRGATDLFDETGKKIGKAGEYGETKGAIGRVVDRAITDFKDFWRFGKDFVDTFEPNNHNLRTVEYGAYKQAQATKQPKGVNPETQGEQEDVSESSSFRDTVQEKVGKVGDIVEGVFTGLSPEEKMRVKYSPYVKEKFDKLVSTAESEGGAMNDSVLAEALYNEVGDKIIATFDKIEGQLGENIPAYQQLRKVSKAFDFSSTPQAITDLFDKWNIKVSDEGRLDFSGSPFADSSEMLNLQRVFNIVKNLSMVERTPNEFLNLRTQLNTFVQKYANDKGNPIFKLLSKIYQAVTEEGHKLIPHLKEIDKIRSDKHNKIAKLKEGRVYKGGDNKGGIRNNFYSIIKNLLGENRRTMLNNLEEFYPGIREELEAIDLAIKLYKKYQKAPEMMRDLGRGGMTGGMYGGSAYGPLGVLIGSLIGAVVENVAVKPITLAVRKKMIDRLFKKMSPQAKAKMEEIAEKQRYASELSESETKTLENIVELIKDEMDGGILDPEKIAKEEGKVKEKKQAEKRKATVKAKREGKIVKKEPKKTKKEDPKALEYFEEKQVPQNSILSLVEPKALENKSPKALVFKGQIGDPKKMVFVKEDGEIKVKNIDEVKKENKSEKKTEIINKNEGLTRFKDLTVEEYRKMQKINGLEDIFKYTVENATTLLPRLALIRESFIDLWKRSHQKIYEMDNREGYEEALAEIERRADYQNLKNFSKFMALDEKIKSGKKLTPEDYDFLGVEDISGEEMQDSYKDRFDEIDLLEASDLDYDAVASTYWSSLPRLVELGQLYNDFNQFRKKYGDYRDINSYIKKTPEEQKQQKYQEMKEIEDYYNSIDKTPKKTISNKNLSPNENNDGGIQSIDGETSQGVPGEHGQISNSQESNGIQMKPAGGTSEEVHGGEHGNVSTLTESGFGSRVPTKSSQRLNNATAKGILEAKNFSTNPADYTADELNVLKNYEGAGGLTKKGEDTLGVQDQFYTPQKVVNKTRGLVDKYIDFEGPYEVLEPTIGTGRFVRKGDNFTGFEIDKVPGTIAKILNPDAKIIIGDFQDKFMDFTGTKPQPYTGPKYDVVIGNPPYKERHTPQRTNGDDKKISRFEEYFIKKGIDVLKEGGILAMVVPSGRLRGQMTRGKEEIMKKAEFLDAYRLPSGVFNNTEVGTDIVVFRRRPHDFVLPYESPFEDARFKRHPEKVLGVEKERRGRFGMETYIEGDISNLDLIDTTPININKGGVEKQRAGSPINDYSNSVNEVIEKNGGLDNNDVLTLESNDPNVPTLVVEKMDDTTIQIAKVETVDGENVTTDGIIGKVDENGKIVPERKITVDGETTEIKKDMLKDQNLESYKPKTPKEKVEKYKPQTEVKEVTTEVKTTTKTKRTTNKTTKTENQTIIKGDDSTETHNLFLGEGNTSEQYLTYRSEMTRDRDVGHSVITDPEHLNYYKGNSIINELYFTGDIYEKLDTLERDKSKMTTEQYEKQKKGLQEVLPTPYTAGDIEFTPVDRTLMDTPTNDLQPYNSYDSDGNPRYMTIGDKFQRYLWNLPRSIGLDTGEAMAWIRGSNMDKKKKGQTISLTKKMFNIFMKSLDGNVLDKIVDNYNRTYRAYVKPDFRKIPLVIKGICKNFKGGPLKLTYGQVQGINFLDLKQGGIVAHGVGHGKTLEGVITTELAIQNGKAKRPLLVVPKNTMVDNWIATYTTAFPNREIVNFGTLSVKDIERLRKEFGNDPSKWIKDGQVAIISKEGFRDKIELYADHKQNILSKLKDQLASKEDSVKKSQSKNEKVDANFGAGSKANKTTRVFSLDSSAKFPKDVETFGDEADTILKRLYDFTKWNNKEKYLKIAKKTFEDNGMEVTDEILKDFEGIREMGMIKIEDLGVDYLTVDEAHNFKNVFSSAETDKANGNDRYGAVKGLSGGSSAMGRKLYLMSQYIQGQTGGNVSLFTATPFNNQALEVYNMLSIIAKNELVELGISNINDFYSLFASFTNETVADNKGGFESKLIMKSFGNVQELKRLCNEFIDYLGDFEGLIKPEKITKKIILQKSEKQEEIQQMGEELIANKKNTGDVLKGIGILRRNLISPYLVTKEVATPKEFYETSPKVQASIEIIKEFKKTGKKDGIFVFFPEGVDYHETYKQAIVEYAGVPAEKIGIINGTTKDPDAIAEQYRKGEIEVLIGGSNTTEGIDLQTNGYITINMQLGRNPTQITQLNGRQWRQGNFSNEVLELIFLYENSVDMKQMQLYEEKSGRIGSIFETQGKVFDTGDIDPEEEKFALCTDPDVKLGIYVEIKGKQMQFDLGMKEQEIQDIQDLQKDLKSEQDKLANEESRKAMYERKLEEGGADTYYEKQLQDTKKEIKKSKDKVGRLEEKLKSYGNIEERLTELNIEKEKIENDIKTFEESLPAVRQQFIEEAEEQAKNRKTIKDYVEDLKVDFARQKRFKTKQELEDYQNAKKKK